MNLSAAQALSVGEQIPILAFPDGIEADEIDRFNSLAYRFDTMKKLRRSDVSQDILKGNAFIKAENGYPDLTVVLRAYSGLDDIGMFYKGITALRAQWYMSGADEEVLPLGPPEILSMDQPDRLAGNELEFAFASLETTFAAVEQALAPLAHS